MCKNYSLVYGSILLYTTVSIIILILITRKKSLFFLNSTDEGEESVRHENISVEIWGKASIAMYLWQHILEGEYMIIENGMGKIGQMYADNIMFNYKYGPLFIQTTVPANVEHLVLVLNGRSDEKIKVAKGWLDYLPKYLKLKKVIVVLLGNEQCINDWILPYMKSRGGRINVAFIIYDNKLVDNSEFYQWPLGVAEYRGFQNIHKDSINVSSRRSYICNFIGTVYSNSSRSKLFQVLDFLSIHKKCPFIGRNKWTPLERKDSLNRYVKTLENSDLTLCPVGQNAECYRIYEAMSYGSVPVVEDRATSKSCDTPFRLLKLHQAPFIYINSWQQLPDIIHSELQMSQTIKHKRRKNILNWYSKFKYKMKQLFMDVVTKTFSN